MTRFPLMLAAIGFTILGLAPIAHAADEPEKVTAGVAPQAASNETRMQRRADHIEGHIAYLKAELMITPAQEAAWDKVADSMRASVKDYEAAVAKLPKQSDDTVPSAIQSLSERSQFASLKAQGEQNFLAAFQPLYDSFSSDQKIVADDVFSGTENK